MRGRQEHEIIMMKKNDGGSGLWHIKGSGIACGGERVSEGDHHIGGHGAV